ncbi:MAG: zinc ribbon domain-containing protein [Planctomycetes bacterium]|nr:zinc ribbon domain-containing protein [Planctomycetota bacterium]
MSVVLAIVFGTLIILANETDWMKELLGQVREEQLMLNLFMTVVASQVVVAILASIGKERAAKLSRKHLGGFMLQFNCPRCGAANRLPTGGATCSACHLEIQIEFDEPRCECGYMLHKLTGINCPECGKVVPEKLRWDSAVSSQSTDPVLGTKSPCIS